jgi:hypothetical protein
MARGDRHKCKCCLKLFRPDPRNRRHQRYCSATACSCTSLPASVPRSTGVPTEPSRWAIPAADFRSSSWCWRLAAKCSWSSPSPRPWSISSPATNTAAAFASIYVGAKHAVEGITKSVALETAKSGIRVNAVAPGPTDTGMLTRFTGTAENKAASATQVPLGRLGLSEEVADGIVFVASDEARFITGHVLNATADTAPTDPARRGGCSAPNMGAVCPRHHSRSFRRVRTPPALGNNWERS